MECVKNNRTWLDNLIVDGRYAWKIFLDLNKQGVVLDLGCGLGNLVSNLAPHVRATYAMDLTFERLEFAQKRFSIFNPHDQIALVAGGDSARLPFADNSLDCVTVSGVLEWVGEGDTAPFTQGSKSARLWRMVAWQSGRRGPRNIQLRFLKEIRRVLKDDAQLFIGIENRLNFAYLFDRPDHHSGLRWGSLLPRPIANLYSIARKRAPYRTYTYSMPGYRKLLRQAGFGKIEFLSLFEGYTDLREIVPADAEVANWRGAVSTPRSLGQRLRRSKYFVPAYGIIANASGGMRESLYDRLLAAIARQAGQDSTQIAIDATHVSQKEKLLLAGNAGDTPIVIKLPLNEAARTAERTNHEILTELTANARCPDFLPRPFAAGDVDDLTFFVEHKMPGVSLSSLVGKLDTPAILRVAEEALLAIESSWPARPVSLEGEVYERFVSTKISEVSHAIDDPELVNRLNTYFYESLYGARLTLGVQHGDFSFSNILVADGRVSGVFDWEAGSTAGLPVLDPINFTISLSIAKCPPGAPGDRWRYVASVFDETSDEASFLKRWYQHYGIEPDHHKALVYLHWLQEMAMRLRFGMACNPIEIESLLYRVANTLPRMPLDKLKTAV